MEVPKDENLHERIWLGLGMSKRWRESARPRAILIPLSLLVLGVWPVRVCAQNVSAQELEREVQFYAVPYQPLPPGTIYRNVSAVEVDVVVRDAKGRAVDGLELHDFELYDNGKQQAITQFLVERATSVGAPTQGQAAGSAPAKAGVAAAASAAPRSIALFFDDRSSSFSDLHDAQVAAEKFVRDDLHPGDEVGVFTASGTETQDYTADTVKLIAAIQAVRPEPLGAPPAPCTIPPPTAYAMGPDAAYMIEMGNEQVAQLYSCQPSGSPAPRRPGNGSAGRMEEIPAPLATDSEFKAQMVLGQAELKARYILGSLESVITQLASRPGQRIVVLISSGFFTLSLESEREDVAESALRAGVVISALDAKGLAGDAMDLSEPNPGTAPGTPPPPGLESDLLRDQWKAKNGVMEAMARDTGGTFFHNNNDLAAGLREVAALPEVSYRLAFSPANLKDDGRFHHLEVKVKAPESHSVQARQGFFAPGGAQGKAQASLEQFDHEVVGTDEVGQLPVILEAAGARLASGTTAALVSVRLSPKALSFASVEGRYFDRLNTAVGLFSPGGKYVAGKMAFTEMNLQKATLAYLDRTEINAKLVVQAPPGDYRLRIVVEDIRSGKVFADSRSIRIP
jgi:VWFA-related protein